ncbi:MAG TPA: hypothetical protein VK817_06725 [Trebonia sp.]|jgi:hypothetical protein|nr:hypothetical protein [Trebonia sp.]
MEQSSAPGYIRLYTVTSELLECPHNLISKIMGRECQILLPPTHDHENEVNRQRFKSGYFMINRAHLVGQIRAWTSLTHDLEGAGMILKALE